MTVQAAEVMAGLTLTKPERDTALWALVCRQNFDYAAARALVHSPPGKGLRPVLLLDAGTGEKWMRVGEVACYWRNVINVGTMSQPTIDGRLAAIGIKRHPDITYKDASGKVWRIRLYRMADGEVPE